MSDHNQLIQVALDSADRAHQLREVALKLKADRHSHRMVYDLFDTVRARLSDGEQQGYDDVLDTMDLIVGWCPPSNAIFDGPME